jgi:adenosylmethionine-8-amino-7-oxononanoate aminotransferase
MVGIELMRDRERKIAYDPAEKIGIRVILEARQHGVIIRPLGSVIVLMPPLSITLEELRRLLDVVRQAIQTVTEGPCAAC